MCKKQTAVSHSSTESEIISLDARLTYGWVFCSRSVGHGSLNVTFNETGAVLDSKTKTPHFTRKCEVDQLSEVDYVPTNTHSSQSESQLYCTSSKTTKP